MEDIIKEIFPSTFREFTVFIIGGLIFRGILSRWLSKRIERHFFSPILDKLGRKLISVERRIAVRLHFKNRVLKHGHQHKSPLVCKDGKCKHI